MTAGRLTLGEVEDQLSNQDHTAVVDVLLTWHPAVLAALLLATTEARYLRYGSSHPDWTKAVREVAERAGLEVSN